MKYFSSQPSFSFANWGVLQLQLPKSPVLTWGLSWFLLFFFFSGCVFLPSWQVGWGDRNCPFKPLHLHFSVVFAPSCVSVCASPLCRQTGCPLKWSPSYFRISLFSLFRVPGSFLSPFPSQSGLVPLFPSAKALGLICFPGWGKTQECDVEKGLFFSFSMPLSSLYFSPPFFFLLFSFFFFFFLLPGFSPRNARTTSVLIQTKLKQQQPLEIKETSLRIQQISKTPPPSHFSTLRVDPVWRERAVLLVGESFETLPIIINHFRIGWLRT